MHQIYQAWPPDTFSRLLRKPWALTLIFTGGRRRGGNTGTNSDMPTSLGTVLTEWGIRPNNHPLIGGILPQGYPNPINEIKTKSNAVSITKYRLWISMNHEINKINISLIIKTIFLNDYGVRVLRFVVLIGFRWLTPYLLIEFPPAWCTFLRKHSNWVFLYSYWLFPKS